MANPNTGNPYNAAITANKDASLIIVSGTAGTSDTTGTAETIRVGGNPATGAIYTEFAGAGTTTSQALAVQIDTSNSGTTYYGFAAPGASGTAAVWQIKREVETGGTQDVFTFADGNANFDNIWNNRGTYSYS